MTDIKWGPAIAVDGKRPAWLEDGQQISGTYRSGIHMWYDGEPDRVSAFDWSSLVTIRLPADHPHYRQTEEAPIDWSGELEAVHEDGRAVAVRVKLGPDNDGDYLVAPPPDGRNCVFHADGSKWTGKYIKPDTGWRIRNVPRPTPQADTKPDLTARMVAFVQRVATEADYPCQMVDFRNEARAIVALLPEPVDPDVELVDEVMFGFGWEREDARFSDVHAVAFDCIKRGRALALAGEKEA